MNVSKCIPLVSHHRSLGHGERRFGFNTKHQSTFLQERRRRRRTRRDVAAAASHASTAHAPGFSKPCTRNPTLNHAPETRHSIMHPKRDTRHSGGRAIPRDTRHPRPATRRPQPHPRRLAGVRGARRGGGIPGATPPRGGRARSGRVGATSRLGAAGGCIQVAAKVARL